MAPHNRKHNITNGLRVNAVIIYMLSSGFCDLRPPQSGKSS
jgi:hypothetical protein